MGNLRSSFHEPRGPGETGSISSHGSGRPATRAPAQGLERQQPPP
jgi:hypothetical protein